MKAIPRAFTAALAACAISLTLWSGVSTRAAASPQATPMPTPMATTVPSPMPTPMPNPAVTPAGNPVPTAPSPGTDMLNSNPNGSGWLDKFNRQPGPEPNGMAPPRKMMKTVPAMSATCRKMWKTAKTAGQRAQVKALCPPPH